MDEWYVEVDFNLWESEVSINFFDRLFELI